MAVIPTHEGKRAYVNLDDFTGSDSWDVIVIGSGMGGMACASALSKFGRKVLVLEQHYIPGGFTHMFGRKGYKWDVGVHAVGEMGEKDLPRKMLDWLTGGQVEMIPLGDPFDRFWFDDGFVWELPDSEAEYKKRLKDSFPEQSAALEAYFRLVKKAVKSAMSFFAFKSLPKGLEKAGNAVKHTFGRDWWATTTSEALDMAGIKGKLRTILTLHWGYYGSIPDESSFAIHALTHSHFWNGAYYPRGGAKSIAAAMLGVVIDAGGACLTRAEVTEVVVENNKAVGVRMANGREFRAKKIVSAAGAKNTVNYLLPDPWRSSDWAAEIRALESSPPYVCLNMGFNGDICEAGASPANLWLFHTWDNNQQYWDLEKEGEDPHILYCSFPSLKDPDHDPGPLQKHTGEAITFLPWEFFHQWQDTLWGKRGDTYDELKDQIEERILATLRRRIPDIMEHLVFYELSTPLSAQFFTKADQGAIYGLKADPRRFTCAALRTRTPLKNFLMTGVDVASLGVVGAMTSGMLTATALEKRVYLQLI
jgi:all-trans-retinol 13,14-reductase